MTHPSIEKTTLGSTVMQQTLELLAANFLIAVACVILLWLITLKTKDPTPMDSFWAFGLLLMAALSFFEAGEPNERRILILVIASVWGLRLGTYMLWRWRKHGPDPRYEAMMRKAQERRGWSYGYASLRLVFLTQAPMLWLTSLPVQLGQFPDEPAAIGTLGLIGASVAIIGILFEAIGDWQLVHFKAEPSNSGKVMDRGLWRYTRHPNYFGDACVWWGVYLIAAETMEGRFAIVGPIFLTWTLLVWSGAALLERRMTRSRPAYADYIGRTSAFIPWFPKSK
jgi:steroid 5-alpha reductase family enzyme